MAISNNTLVVFIFDTNLKKYETLQEFNLHDYIHYIKATPSFSDDVDLQLNNVAQLHKCEEKEK